MSDLIGVNFSKLYSAIRPGIYRVCIDDYSYVHDCERGHCGESESEHENGKFIKWSLEITFGKLEGQVLPFFTPSSGDQVHLLKRFIQAIDMEHEDDLQLGCITGDEYVGESLTIAVTEVIFNEDGVLIPSIVPLPEYKSGQQRLFLLPKYNIENNRSDQGGA